MRRALSQLLYAKVRSHFRCENHVVTSDQLLSSCVGFSANDELNFLPNKYQILNTALEKLELSSQLPALLLGAQGVVSSGCALLANVNLVGKHAYAIHNDRLLLDSCQGRLEYPLYRGDIRSLLLRDVYSTDASFDTAFSLVNGLSANYFHFLIETLPCVENARTAIKSRHTQSDNGKFVCLITRDRPSFIDYWIHLAFGDDAILIEWSFKKASAKTLVLPTLPYRILSPETIPVYGIQRYLASSLHFLRNLGTNITHTSNVSLLPRKIYISRRGVSRVVVNETDVEALLYRNGYSRVFLEDLPISTQVLLFREATHLVAIHGASLANLVFASECQLIELYPDNRDPQLLHYYAQISSLNGISHSVLLCKGDKSHNIYVDTSALQDLL